MDKLSQFYLKLATNADLMTAFNQGNSSREQAIIRTRLLKNAGIDTPSEIVSMSQEKLRELIANNLVDRDPKWQSLNKNVANSNTDNSVSSLGRRHIS